MADLKMMLQNLRDKSKCCKKDDFTGERYTIIHDMSIETLNMICDDGIEQLENAQTVNRWIPCSEMLPEKTEVRHGEWEYRHADDWMFCTACGADAVGDCGEPLETLYCPNCGARMNGGADNVG